MTKKFDVIYESVMNKLNKQDNELTDSKIKVESKDDDDKGRKLYAEIEYDNNYEEYLIVDSDGGEHIPRQKGYSSKKEAIQRLLDEGYEKIGKNEYCGYYNVVVDNQEALRSLED